MRDLYTVLVSKLLFPLHEQLKGHTTPAVLRCLEQSQWWDIGRLESLQLERLCSLAQHTQRHVRYYTRLFADIGFDPSDIQSLADLARLPFLAKADIRAHAEELKADDSQRLTRFNTGGSSGEPLIFWIGKERVSRDVAAKWRATRWWDVDIGDPEVVVWGSPIELGAQDRLRALRDRVLRTKLLPAFEMSEPRLDEFVRQIRAMRPRMLFGYPSALSHIAWHADKSGQRMDDLGIRVAFVTSERLYDHQREQIAKTFGCRVANGYGGRDAGFIAHECPKGGMHIMAEDIIVETIDEKGHDVSPGQPGEIVITHLATREFPFIRYRTGDVGVLDGDTCPCGRGLPLLKEIQGRATDFVVTRDGTVMHGLALIYVVRDHPEVEQFKIIQESVERTRVLVVPGPGYDHHTDEVIRTGLRRRLGSDVEVSVERVQAIPRETSGKYGGSSVFPVVTLVFATTYGAFQHGLTPTCRRSHGRSGRPSTATSSARLRQNRLAPWAA
jgi:phenylacetate-CoA ligase